MASLRRFFDPAWWVYWTVGGRGIRDAVIGVATERHTGTVATPKGDLDALASLLQQLSKDPLMGQTGVPGPPGGGDDLGHAMKALRHLMRERGTSIDDLGENRVAQLVQDMASAVAAARQKDAAENGQSASESLTFYEAEMVDIAEEQISRLCEAWEKAKHGLEARAKQVGHRLEELRSQYHSLVEQHRAKGFRAPEHMIGPRIYPLALALLGILELPINFEAFQILQQTKLQTLFIASGPSLAIIVLAHFLGITCRRNFSARRAEIAASVLAGVFLSLGLLGIAFLRAEWFAYLTGAGPASSPTAGIDWSQTVALLAVNLLFLAAGVCVSILAHDPDGELDRVWREKHNVRQEYDRVWDRWIDVAGRYDELRGVTLQKIQQIRDDARAKLHEYRSYNTRYASGIEAPAAFRESVTDRLFIPRHLGDELDRPPAGLGDVLAPGAVSPQQR